MSGPTLLKAGNLEEVKDPRDNKIIYSPTKDVLDKHRPIDYIMSWIDKRRANMQSVSDRVLILQSSTGSGKSTIIPPEFYHRFSGTKGDQRSICCTQPRVLTSITIPSDIIQYHTKEALTKAGYPNRTPLKLGDNIGFQTGAISKRPIRGVIYMTIGVLMQQLNIMSDEDFMAKYSCVILDEVHDRSIATDDVLYAMKKFIMRNPSNKNCPFVITMSATFDVWKFANYLLSSVEPPQRRYDNIIKVAGFTFPIENNFAAYDATNYIQAAADKVAELHKNNRSDFELESADANARKLTEDVTRKLRFRDIMVFVSGLPDMRKVKKKLDALNSSDEYFLKYPVLIVQLDRVAVNEQTRDFENMLADISKLNVEVMIEKTITVKKPVRRVIVSTNVGETGLTIPTLKYAIDTGWFKSSEFNPTIGTSMLVAKPVTRGMATQRRGRAGRVSPGAFHPIYTEATWNALQTDQYPDFVKDEITLNILSLLIRECDPENYATSVPLITAFASPWWNKVQNTAIDITAIDMLDLPSADSLHYSMQKLYALGAMSANSIPTKIGFIMNRFRFVSIESIRMILAGYAWGASILDLINITAILQIGRSSIILENLSRNFARALSGGSDRFHILSKKMQYRMSDDFIWGALIFNEFQIFLQNIEIAKYKYEDLQKWCDQHGISLSGLYQVIELREDIINMIALIGFDPYANFENSIQFMHNNPIAVGESIIRLKQCIFEGFKLNIAIWNPQLSKYITRDTHVPFDISDTTTNFVSAIAPDNYHPRYIIYDKLSCMPKMGSDLYGFSVSTISVLDGFIPIDPNWDIL